MSITVSGADLSLQLVSDVQVATCCHHALVRRINFDRCKLSKSNTNHVLIDQIVSLLRSTLMEKADQMSSRGNGRSRTHYAHVQVSVVIDNFTVRILASLAQSLRNNEVDQLKFSFIEEPEVGLMS